MNVVQSDLTDHVCPPDVKISVRIRQNPDYAYGNCMYRKGLGPSNLSGLDENPDNTCPD